MALGPAGEYGGRSGLRPRLCLSCLSHAHVRNVAAYGAESKTDGGKVTLIQ